MSHKHIDIDDDEIRVISATGDEPKGKTKHNVFLRVLIAALLIVGIAAAVIFSTKFASKPDDSAFSEPVAPVTADSVIPAKAFTTLRDTIVNGTRLGILTPRNATPVLVVGNGVLNDTAAVLAVQAADVRGDNGMIAGTFVVNGDLVSKGEAKAGFCSIINGEITIGVADATPMLEQALADDGYFFRQYPLVVGSQLVENKPKGKAKRKALAEIDGEISVVFTHERVTFHDFSQALIDAGVRNAIYLVGADSSGFYVDSSGVATLFSPDVHNEWEYINYIVWR
ncbi:MAG: phosphodiester glycosidase family protein [Duncaniella sp.]|nr:phosphodiester glycosidase family protein [Duncaniella sp.]